MTLQDYINKYDNPTEWFSEEVKKGFHIERISKVIDNRNYLKGIHKVLLREDAKYKGKEFITRKIILQYAKTILNFHSTYLLGKSVSLSGTENMVKEFNNVYRLGQFNNTDFLILDKVNKFADCYEVIYINDGVIKSKLINSEDGFPVYSDDTGEYIGFVEHWTDAVSNISFYNVYYPTYVEHWSNEGGELHLIDTKINVAGLPIHYHNYSDWDDNFGKSELDDIKPILDELEDIYSKLGDSIYTNSLNPMNVAIGQRIESSIPADAVGYVINLDAGDYKVVSTNMDYNTIKLYLDNLKQMLNDIACIPGIISSNSNVANVSEVSLKLLFHLASVKAMQSEKWLKEGFRKRFDVITKILDMQGVHFSTGEYVDVEFNYSIPVATGEVISNLKTQFDMGAISKQTIIEKSPLTNNVSMEMERIQKEGSDTGENKE
ncbi:phage portal protein [Clostridium sp. BNL1100]|uniref:phage portal protein n=1 Tax=Clostridium sp. BNL1100 TaxID=755731 RepID=UPI00024A775E|nr:phage portal protein [Clostridium sp. BNL1100]AEY67837.1 Phage portal protein, SPP1 Gp6 [Clostridium sp. BNL1100]